MILGIKDYLPASIDELGTFALHIASIVILVWAFCFIVKTIIGTINKFRS